MDDITPLDSAASEAAAPRPGAAGRPGSRYDPDESIGYLIKKTHQSLHRAVDDEMTPLDLTAMQWGPLMLLSMGKGDTAADLARSVGCDTGAMTRMIDRLESKGLVRRVRSQDDRRVILLELTDEGARASDQIPQALQNAVDRHTRGFSPDEQAQLKHLLRRMIANGDLRQG